MAIDKNSTGDYVDLVNTSPDYFDELGYIDGLAFALEQESCECVFSMTAYDSEMFECSVYQYGKYYILKDMNGFRDGPFTSLQDAIINTELNVIYESITSIWVDLDSDELTKILVAGEELPKGFTFQVNDSPWEMGDTSKFRPKQAI